MKLYILAVLSVLMAANSFAQQTTTAVKAVADTVRDDVYQNGKIKMVNGVAMNSGRDIVQNLSQSANYNIFIKALRSSGMVQTVKSRGPITFFVPDNKAFSYLPAGVTDTLMKKNHILELTNLLTYHAVAGELKAKDISKMISDGKGNAELITLAGGKLKAHIDANRNIVLVDDNGNESIISTFDIPQNNGMAHLITRVLVPKYKVI